MKKQQKIDEDHMRECLSLAAQARGRTFPNPLVASVVVKDKKVVGRGIHFGVGTAHAESLALKQAGSKARGADLYVNLEPCCHYGNTPPCTEAILKAKIRRVVFAIKDPHPLVKKGNSQLILQKAGIQVTAGILASAARRLNEVFLKFHETGRPFVFLKLAASLDGRIATASGESQWITGEIARQYVQLLRREADAILVGANTVLRDDPQLTVRDASQKKVRQPLRVILDSKLRLPLKARVLNQKAKGATLLFTTTGANKQKLKAVRGKGVEVLVIKKDENGQVDLKEAVRILTKRQITSILIEGGGEIAASAIKDKLVDKIYYFIAPFIIGGKDSVPAVGGEDLKHLKDAYVLKEVSCEKLGQDLLFQAYL